MNKLMKLMYAMLCGVMALGMAACGGDDDEPDAGATASLMGSWNGNSYYNNQVFDDEMTMRFSEDGTLKIWETSRTGTAWYYEGTYTASKSAIMFDGWWDLASSTSSSTHQPYKKNIGYSIREGVLYITFQHQDWKLTKVN